MARCVCGHESADHHNEERFCCNVPEAANYCQVGDCGCESFTPEAVEPPSDIGEKCKNCGELASSHSKMGFCSTEPSKPSDGLVEQAIAFIEKNDSGMNFAANHFARYKNPNFLAEMIAQAIAADRAERAEESGQPVTAGPEIGVGATCEIDTPAPVFNQAPDDLIAEAKEWLEANTPLKWATEPDPECPDEPLESLNRRQQRWAERLASFARQREIKAIDEFVRRMRNRLNGDQWESWQWRKTMESVAEEMKR